MLCFCVVVFALFLLKHNIETKQKTQHRNKAKNTTKKQSKKHNTETKQKTQQRNKAKNTT
jgi:large-conductance mechanosensitive channel